MKISINEIFSIGWHSGLIDFKNQSSDFSIEYKSITADSRKAVFGSIFFAFDGIQHPGKNYIPDALKNQISAVFVDQKYESELNEIEKNCNVPFFYSDNFKEMAAKTISLLYQNPSSRIKCIGITGTNGKTTIAWAIYSILKKLNKRPGYIGTIGIELPDESILTSLTTPPVDEMHRLLHLANLQHGDFMVTEASSHGLSQGRLAGISWDIVMFTNLTEDHRDYHKTMDDYYLAKKILFKNWADNYKNSNGAAIINTDDDYGNQLFKWLKTSYPELTTISVGKKSAMVKIISISPSWKGYHTQIEFNGNTYILRSKCIGSFNIYNLTMAFIGLVQLGFHSDEVLHHMENFTGAPGRMEMYHKINGGMILVDYAHTPDALKKSLETLKELQPEKLVVVFGCGGDRDREKRSQMGKIADENADFTILTNDNPRTEKPEMIIDQIKSGISKNNYKVIFDRRQAIEEAIYNLQSNEVLLIAGKGHEDYQILPEGKIKFSDSEVVRETICKI
ncbi:MAG: UDP-N-acetylmuramoyl-L-alanyl-D-glutamate--2,6-diaminopimelate ligase [Spirochaetia bacterium]|nr:UDP-N-acetylmuramoyl-L-alanyl-D-glutamate--2,6-diaminopimelate ligase [Spirochaetia bacterium]